MLKQKHEEKHQCEMGAYIGEWNASLKSEKIIQTTWGPGFFLHMEKAD